MFTGDRRLKYKFAHKHALSLLSLYVRRYDSAKSLIDKVFGVKAAKSFPRKIVEGSCGDGYYPSEIGNTPPGIDLEIDVGKELAAPFTGTVTQSGPTQVIIELYEELPHTEIIIDHVDVSKDVLESGEVSKGLELGTVTDSGCRPNAIHLAMRRIGTEEYIDPTEYIENRDMDTSTVYWNQGCDEYLLILKNDVIAGPKPLVGGSVMSDESPERIDEPDLSDLGHFGDLEETDKEHQDNPKFSTVQTKKTKDNSIETAFDLHVKQVSELSLEEALELLDDVGQTHMKEQLEDLMSQLQSCLLSHDFKRPETMIYEELSLSSKTREVESGNSSRSMLQWQYRQPQNRCSHLWTYLPSETFCNFDIDCLGIYCDVEMDLFYFPVHFPVSLRVQNCQLIAGLAGVEEIFDMIDLASEGPVEYKDVAMDGIKIFEDVILEYSLTVAMIDTDSESHLAKVMLKARICSNISDYCLSQVSIFEELTLVVDECSEIVRPVEDPQG
ncbi:uncharacterized protein [Ptychodera flava]|uniref:uncharacterized protein n=1 Tax=Ptychodera flava TaxID=63121 RepID=UPI00396A8679